MMTSGSEPNRITSYNVCYTKLLRVSDRRVISLVPGQPRHRILVVDDRPDNRQLLIRLLNPLGFDLREARNGQEGLEI